MKSTRADWTGFPPVVRNGDLNTLSCEPEYMAAKSGNAAAALALIERLMTDRAVESIASLITDPANTRIIPVQAEEATGRNKIPLAIAEVLADRLGLEVDYSICQIERVRRTGASADHRLAYSPSFDGSVDPGKAYLIVDDTLTMGGTLAALRGHLMQQGGVVLGAAVMTAHEGAVNLPVTLSMLERIHQKHGSAMNDYWQQEFGYGIEKLTQGEAGHLRAAASVEAMRDRIAAARDAARRPVDEAEVGREPQDKLTLTGYGEYRQTQLTAAIEKHRSSQLAFWNTGTTLPALREKVEARASSLGIEFKAALENIWSDDRFSDIAKDARQHATSAPETNSLLKRMQQTKKRVDKLSGQSPAPTESVDMEIPQ